jgi:hypothetical protein
VRDRRRGRCAWRVDRSGARAGARSVDAIFDDPAREG